MNQDNEFSSPTSPLQPLGQKRLRNSDTHSSPTNECEHLFVTLIRATNVACGLRRIPAGFYVIVEVDGRIIQTSNKPASAVNDVVKWDEEILLSSNPSSSILFSVYASIELGPRLGNGELLRQFRITVGEVFSGDGRNELLQPIDSIAQQGDSLPLCASINITTERRICDTNESCPKLDAVPESREMNMLECLTNEGCRALLRYRQWLGQMDLDAAIQAFEQVQEVCPIGHPNLSAVLFNLANAKFIDCQVNSRYLDLDAPIGLYRDVLRLRSKDDPDHCRTALELSLALLARFQRRGFEFDREEATDLLAGVVETSATESYTYRAGLFALQMTKASISVEIGDAGFSPAEQANDDDVIQEKRDLLQNLSYWSPHRLALLVDLGMLLSDRFGRNGVLADICEAISMFECAVDLTSHSHPDTLSLLDAIGNAMLRRFNHIGGLVDMLEAVCMTPNGPPDKPSWLNILGTSLLSRFERLGDLADLNKSISMFEEAVCLMTDSHPSKSALLIGLGASLSFRFERLGDLADLNRSISVKEDAVCLMSHDHPDKPGGLSNLGNSLLGRFVRFGDLADVNRSISVREEAVHLTPDGHPDKPAQLSNLGNSLYRRFERLGNFADLTRSISMQEEAVYLTPNGHPDKPAWLNNLGDVLLSRFEHLGDLADLNRSNSMLEEAVRLTADGHPNKPAQLNNLGSSLSYRFEHLGNLADLVRSISIFEEAVYLTPNGHPNKPSWLNHLGNSLLSRFEHLGDLVDLNRTILIFEEAVCLMPDGHLDKPTQLNSLGSALSRRFERLADLADLNRSISMFEEAAYLTPGSNPDKWAWLNNLGTSLLSRFDRLGDLADLDKSISIREETVCLMPDGHLDKPALLNNLGCSLSRRFEHLGDLADLNKSISMQEEAVHLSPDGRSDKPAWLYNLGNSLCHRFQRLGDHEDIVKSISIQEEAISITPDGHPDKPAFLIGLGNAFNNRFQHTCDPSDLSAAAFNFSIASGASIGRASTRFNGARAWISCAQLQGNTTALLDACASALDLLPQLAWVGLPVSERHRLLVQVAVVTRDSVAAALEAGYPEMAVEWLEQGRSVVWTQFLHLRTPVDDLAHEHPALARQFRQISQELEHASARDSATFSQSAKKSVADTRLLEKDIQRHHDLALKREDLLLQIRSLPGFDRFLLSKELKQLAALAISGPVVYLAASEKRCDALIVMAELESVIHVPLTEICYIDIEVLRRMLRGMLEQHCLVFSRDALYELIPSEHIDPSKKFLDLLLDADFTGTGSDRAVKSKQRRFGGYSPNELYQMILKHLWNYVVNPVCQALGFSSPPSGTDQMTRIFWCPTGPFSFLPIHAAGRYDTTKPGTKLSDFVISSYLPTLSSLASSPQNSLDVPSPKLRLLAVPQPLTDGLGTLFSVEEEINSIRGISDKTPFVTLQDSDGTVEDVMEKLKNTDWVHFACHGIQDPKKPLDSGLGLANNRRLKLSNIMQLSRPQGGLAFLSACQTAQGDQTLSEESVHLAAGMLLAGYDSVIGTMWAIRDDDAPKVARDVYEYLFRDARDSGQVPDSTESAAALHCAVQRLRESGAPFTSWVPFIHFGR